jgi:hypothetical protein
LEQPPEDSSPRLTAATVSVYPRVYVINIF